MSLLTWSPNCTVSVRAMDEQHGILMDAMNEVRLSVMHGCGKDLLSDRIGQLIQLVAMHFRNEEQLMEQCGYPGLDEHRDEHRRLFKLLRDSAHRVRHDAHVQLSPLLCLMRDEYLDHIGGLDQGYGPWLNVRGVD